MACESEFHYSAVVANRADIHDVVECAFEETSQGFEQYTCVPVFSADDEAAQPWEQGGVGDFDILQREIFGAAFYQMWYSGQASSASEVGYAVSMDGVEWIRHPYNPVLKRGGTAGAFDRDDASVACAAFDGYLGVYHLWYTGTNSATVGTTFGHATSLDGIYWTKDLFNPLDPLEDGSELSRVWSCDALYEDGLFHFWAAGVNWDGSVGNTPQWLASSKYDIAYLSTVDGTNFEVDESLALEHREMEGSQFDAEGVNSPSVFTYGDGEIDDRYWMIYGGYRDVIATDDPGSSLIYITSEGEALGMASSASASNGWTRTSDSPLPLDFSGQELADSPRAFFINGRLHVFFTDVFGEGDSARSGIGLGLAPFPVLASEQ